MDSKDKINSHAEKLYEYQIGRKKRGREKRKKQENKEYTLISASFLVLILFLIAFNTPNTQVIGAMTLEKYEKAPDAYFITADNCPACEKQQETLQKVLNQHPQLHITKLERNKDKRQIQEICFKNELRCSTNPIIVTCDKNYVGYQENQGKPEYLPAENAYKGQPRLIEETLVKCYSNK